MRKKITYLCFFFLISLSFAKTLKPKLQEKSKMYSGGTKVSFLFKQEKNCISAVKEFIGSGWSVQCNADSMQKNRLFTATYNDKGSVSDALAKIHKIKSIKTIQLLR